jgi:malonate-semialdehyde dehydrogenase (acetylating)/methylmalonate-semialdehyde dehydrogenase
MVPNFINGQWTRPEGKTFPIFNPATGETIDEVPLSSRSEVDRAVDAATRAYTEWSRTSVMERTALMFRFKAKLEEHFEELASIVTRNHGKTLEEARGEVRRGIEVVDFACSAPTLLQGRTLRQVTTGVDQDLYRFPVGVVVGIPPFNFPAMIPLWMFPLAVVCGNTFVLKPSERTPLAAVLLASLFKEAGLPDGVLNLVNGAQETVETLIRHPYVNAVSFVGSEPVARKIYQECARNGKRVQALGGAKNHIVVMPDADLTTAVPAILGSAFGNAGERCLAGSVTVAVGRIHDQLSESLAEGARALRVGPGDSEETDVGPLIRREHRDRVASYIDQGVREGAVLLVDGRPEIERAGFFLGPTILDRVKPEMSIGREEIFGPVLSISSVQTLDEAIKQANAVPLGNMAVMFTESGRAAREFREKVEAGMVGINVPVAQPFAFFPFSGWKASFYGDLHIHGTDGVDFYTRKKMLITRW